MLNRTVYRIFILYIFCIVRLDNISFIKIFVFENCTMGVKCDIQFVVFLGWRSIFLIKHLSRPEYIFISYGLQRIMKTLCSINRNTHSLCCIVCPSLCFCWFISNELLYSPLQLPMAVDSIVLTNYFILANYT